MSDDLNKAVHIKCLNIDSYMHKEICTGVDQTVEPENALWDDDEARLRALSDYFHNYTYEHARTMMTIHFSATANLGGAI